MRCIKFLFIGLLIIGIYSCEKSDESNNYYSNVMEINLPTDSPRGLAFDGKYLWYSDDSLGCLYKISENGDILTTIQMPGCRLTGFDFNDGCIWCINDTTVGYETVTEAHYPLSCIYKLSLSGEKLDSILMYTSDSPRPIFLGMTMTDSTIYGTTNQGWSSQLYKIDPKNQKRTLLKFCYFNGLTIKNDTLYAIDIQHIYKTRIAPLGPDYNIILERTTEIDFRATDLAFVSNDLWVCDREEKKLKRIK